MPESKWEGMVANLLFVSIITQQKLFSIKTKPFLDYINLSLIANFCYLKIGISPLQCLTSCGGYWKKLTAATRYITLRKMGEIKQWMDRVTKPCHQAAWKQKKSEKKEKAKLLNMNMLFAISLQSLQFVWISYFVPI